MLTAVPVLAALPVAARCRRVVTFAALLRRAKAEKRANEAEAKAAKAGEAKAEAEKRADDAEAKVQALQEAEVKKRATEAATNATEAANVKSPAGSASYM